jgi:hypothetical protein
MTALEVCPKCRRRGYMRKKGIYGHKYYYFKHYCSEKPKEHYLGKEKPKFKEDKERRSCPILNALRKLLKLD